MDLKRLAGDDHAIDQRQEELAPPLRGQTVQPLEGERAVAGHRVLALRVGGVLG
jgi:hypothetical protein